MKYVKAIVFLMIWYVISVAALYFTLRFMGGGGKWTIWFLAMAEVSAAIFMAASDNLLTSLLGRFPTFIVLTLLLGCGLPSIFYISMFVTGETL